MKAKIQRRQELIDKMERRAYLKSWQEKKKKRLEVIQEEDEVNVSEEISEAEISRKRKKFIAQQEKQFALDRQEAAAELIEN